MLEQNIIAALGLESLPDERKAALIDKMAQLVEKNLIVRIMEGLSEADAGEFETIAQSTDEDKVKFLQAKFPNFAEMMQEEIVNVKKAVLQAGAINE
jgi:biotin synthase-related radical SAM superfamily protein